MRLFHVEPQIEKGSKHMYVNKRTKAILPISVEEGAQCIFCMYRHNVGCKTDGKTKNADHKFRRRVEFEQLRK